jgi:hypothetical protein
MRRARAALLLAAFVMALVRTAVVGAIPPVHAIQTTALLPSGAHLQARLTTGVSSAKSRAGDPVSAVITVDAAASGLVVPAGTVIRGVIRQVTPFSWSASQAVLALDFRELVPPAGAAVAIAARIVAIDNARETVDATGRILGITPPRQAPSGAEDALLLAAVVPEVYDLAMFSIRELERPDIVYGPGTDLVLETLAPTSNAPVREPRADAAPDVGLMVLSAAQTPRTMAGTPARPADVINVVINATDDELSGAFTAAGWNTAVALGLRADARTVLAVAEDRGYTLGPVSLQSWSGRPPDRVFQKQTNTFDRRHHVRIWRAAQTHDGRPLWAASATHDIGIKFARAERTFTHRVETDIDLERQKIVDDLRFAGVLERSAFARRVGIPATLTNATGDAMTTDGRVAVLVLRRR